MQICSSIILGERKMINILSVCDNEGVFSIVFVFKLLIDIICYITPVVLIVSILLQLVKAIMGDVNKHLDYGEMVKKIVAAIAVFILPSLISSLLVLLGGNTEFAECLNKASPGVIDLYNEVTEAESSNENNATNENVNLTN